jgi:hypothetical protein
MLSSVMSNAHVLECYIHPKTKKIRKTMYSLTFKKNTLCQAHKQKLEMESLCKKFCCAVVDKMQNHIDIAYG